jgi:hypothetical protein
MDDRRQRFIDAHISWYEILGTSFPMSSEQLGIEWDAMNPKWRDGALANIETHLIIAKAARSAW